LCQFASYNGFEQIQFRPQLRDFRPQITGQYFTSDHRKITNFSPVTKEITQL